MVTINRICVDCGKNISKLQPQCMRCKQCQRKFRERKDRKEAFLSNKKVCFDPLGTTNFGEHREKDFKKEAAAVKKEMKELGLR